MGYYYTVFVTFSCGVAYNRVSFYFCKYRLCKRKQKVHNFKFRIRRCERLRVRSDILFVQRLGRKLVIMKALIRLYQGFLDNMSKKY